MKPPALLLRVLFVHCLFLLSSASLSAPAATVEAVRSPAWVADRGTWAPVPAGYELEAGDQVRTGPGGRVLLRLAEGSELRIGGEASFVLVRLDPPVNVEGAFTGLLKVARGALRFTTTRLSRSHRRSLDIQVASVNAGISGTDVWAKAGPDRDIVCLLEGRITVAHGDDVPQVLDQPLSFYVVPRGGPAKPVAPATQQQLEKWQPQVALAPGSGVITGGPWKVALASFRKRDRAEQALVGFHNAGLPVAIVPLTIDGTLWHRLVVSGFDHRAEARAFIQRIDKLADISAAWVYR
jgi:hypothetical protein